MNQSVLVKRVRVSDLVLKVLIYFAAAISILLLVGIMCYTFYRGFSSISLEFLTTVPSTLNGTFGIAGNLLNTLYIVLITLLIATPIGVGSAIYLNEYAKPGKIVRAIEFTTEILSGIPSIIFGLFGMVFFGTTLGLGYSILTGALTLTLMVLPLITRTTQEALKTVPDSYRSGALGIGATKWYMIRTILLPGKLCRKLKKYARAQKTASGEIFRTRSGKSLSRRQIWAEMKRLCKSAGVAPSKVFPHNLRHLFARTFYKVCRDVVKLADVLGHSSVETTRIYLISTGAEHMKILSRMHLIQ